MTTPYSSVPAPYAGATPTWPTPWPDRSTDVWLGVPGNMVQLPPPDLIDPLYDGAEVVHGLYGGGSATTDGPNVRRSWTIEWPSLLGREWQLVYGFYRKVIAGRWPWCMVTGEDVNKLTNAQSMCSSGWSASGAGSVTFSSPTAPYITPGGTMQWLPSAAGESLIAANIVSGTFTPDTDHGVPYIPALPLTFSCWVWKSAGTAQFQPRLRACNADGSGNQVISNATVTVGTTWQPVSISVGPNAFGSLPYVFPVLGSIDGGQFRISNPMLTYSYPLDDTDWELGSGVPRVSPTGPPTRDMSLYPSQAASWTLAETITGAA